MTLETATPGLAFVMDLPFWIATVVFFTAYGMIIAEKMHKTVVAIFAASLMLVRWWSTPPMAVSPNA